MAHAHAASVEEQAAKALHTPLLAARAEVEAALDTAAFPRDDLRVCIEELQAERVRMEELFCETIAAECAAVQDALAAERQEAEMERQAMLAFVRDVEVQLLDELATEQARRQATERMLLAVLRDEVPGLTWRSSSDQP